MRAVLDTSVLVAAIRSHIGASKALLERALKSQFRLLISTALVLEYEAVLTLQEHLLPAGLAASEIDELLDMICSVGTQVRLARRVRPRLPDANDEMVLETAVNGRADAIVTFNRADFTGIAEEFGIKVLTPLEFLRRMEIR